LVNALKIAVFSFGRSDYGLLRNLVFELETKKNLDVTLIATGSHFLERFGNSIEEVKRDNFNNLLELQCVSGSSEASDIVQDMARCLSEFGKCLSSISPDMVVLLGDRFETLTAASAALILRIPIAHINGGELTVGAFDDAIRHSITKMSAIHFVANETYEQRVLQLGEESSRVHNVGHLAADSFSRLEPMSQNELENILGFTFRPFNFLVTIHPETASSATPEELTDNLLAALGEFPEAGVIFTAPNPDPGHAVILKEIKKFIEKRPNCVLVGTLGHRAYLSIMQLNTVVVGNSSSGVLEAPIIGVPSVDIGNRQQGRVTFGSIRHCNIDHSQITQALRDSIVSVASKTNSQTFHKASESVSSKISNILANLVPERLSTKSFQDL
jgi:UDP-hydrolysing UDP-N-acetyl-D-glucosamine 2-epimerase